MSDLSPSKTDPDAGVPTTGLLPFTRRKAGPAKIALAVVLATIITAITFGALSLILWGLATIFH